MKKLVATLVSGGVALCVAGCSTDSEPKAVRAVANETSTAQPTRDPDAPLEKKVGERAYWGCTKRFDTTAEAEQDCALVFTVTDIADIDPSDCSSYDLEGNDGARIVRVSIDADARKALPGVTPRSSPAGVLITQFWGGVSQDGYVTAGETMYSCGDLDTPDYGPFHQTLAIGRKGRGTMSFALPANSVKLNLAYFDSPGWEWNLPSH